MSFCASIIRLLWRNRSALKKKKGTLTCPITKLYRVYSSRGKEVIDDNYKSKLSIAVAVSLLTQLSDQPTPHSHATPFLTNPHQTPGVNDNCKSKDQFFFSRTHTHTPRSTPPHASPPPRPHKISPPPPPCFGHVESGSLHEPKIYREIAPISPACPVRGTNCKAFQRYSENVSETPPPLTPSQPSLSLAGLS